MNRAATPYYRLVRSLVSGKRILDLHGAATLGAEILRESGNHVDVEAQGPPYDLVLAFDEFRAAPDPRSILNRLRDQLAGGGIFAVSSRVAPSTGVADPETGELAFRLESLAKLLQDYFRVVTYAFLHGDSIRAEWDQYSDRVVFFCRFLKPTQLPETGPFLENLDTVYGGTIKGLVPFSVPYLRAWMERGPEEAPRDRKGTLLFYLQPLPLYDDPLLYQWFFERYFLLGEQYRDRGWNVFYSVTSELKALYGADHTFSPDDFRHPPHIRDWRTVYAKTLHPEVSLKNRDLTYWAGYTSFLLDRTRPDAIFVWNKSVLLDRIAAERGVPVIHNEVCLDRDPRPRTYFFDPQGVNAESSIRDLWGRFRNIELPPCCHDLLATFRRCYVDPWLGSGSRAELLNTLGLDPSKKTIFVPLQVENDSNVLRNSSFRSMSEFCRQILSALPRNKYNVLIKPHPADPLGTKLAPSIASRARVLDGGRAMGPLLQASDCVFTISSTAGYEALLAGKPVVAFGRSVYSHLGFTVDLETAGGKARIDPPFSAAPQSSLDRFIFLASMLYPLSERSIASAELQEPLLQRALECHRRNAPIWEYWPDPATIDWERFCFDKMSEWLDAPRSLSMYSLGLAPPAAADRELLASLRAIEQEQAAADVELQAAQDNLARAEAEIGRLEAIAAQSSQEHAAALQKHAAELAAAQSELQRITRNNSGLHKVVAALRTEIVREKRAGDAARKVSQELQDAVAAMRTSVRALEERLRDTGDAAAREQLRLAAEVDSVSHNNAHLRKQLDTETEKCRVLEMELRTAHEHAAVLEQSVHEHRALVHAAEQRLLQNRLKRLLHSTLDGVQRLVPEQLRRTVRPLYLRHVYYRIYPEKRPSVDIPARPAARLNAASVLSTYPAYVELKQRLCANLPMDGKVALAGAERGLVSIVLPVYNGARYVAQSIESVLAQTYSNFELIIVDDGSTDETPGLLERYAADPRVRIVRQSNQKLPAALNRGFARATGEYRNWTSDDNIMLPEMIAELVSFLEQHRDAEMVYADQEVIGESGEPLLNSDYCPGYQTPPGGNLICWPRDPGELNFVQNNYLGGCFLYRSWAGALVGEYSRSRFLFEDYDYWMRMNALFRVKHLGQRRALYRYRLHGQSLSARERELQITDRVRNFMSSEEQRRNYFAAPFDVALCGRHPWFSEIAAAYLRAGHNVVEARDGRAAGRSFDKLLAIAGEGAPDNISADVVVRLGGAAESPVECMVHNTRLQAESARSLLYPMLAGANAAAYEQRWHTDRARAADLQHA